MKGDEDKFQAAQRAIEQNALSDGSQVELDLQGRKMSVEASKHPRYKLSKLMDEMTSEPPRVEGWVYLISEGLAPSHQGALHTGQGDYVR